jgi:WD40 repeat protein
MHVLEVGPTVFLLRFLPDGRRLVVGTVNPPPDQKVTFEVLSLPGGERVRLDVPGATIDAWWYYAWYGNAIAVHPSGESCHIAWGDQLYAFRTEDGTPLPVPKGVRANQIALSADGERILVAYRTRSGSELFGGWPGTRKGKVWHSTLPEKFSTLAGFLPDGERFVTVEDKLRVWSFASREILTSGRHKPVGSQHPQISPDGRYLGVIGYHSMYFWDLTTLDKPRRISGSSSFGDFRSFAFHPNGKTVAIIHGGPTLVKVYDVGTLKLIHKWTWKLGPLRSVAYSPDGTVAAAGSEDGRIVFWDVDE